MGVKYKIGIWGQYGDGGQIADGQAVRTTIVTGEVKKRYGEENIKIVNSNNWKSHPLSFFLKTVSLVVECEKVIIAPADNGFKTIVPILDFFNRIFHRKMLYMVIGGFLPKLLEDNPKYIKMLRKYERLYVQTPNIKTDLEKLGITKVDYLTNLKPIEAVPESELKVNQSKEIRLCTFSRINPEKGIEEALEAVRIANKKLGGKYITLDMYGIVAAKHQEWFSKIKEKYQDIGQYCGVVNYDQTVDTLRQYFALIFPTYYHGEGFSGNVVDACFSGVPIIATDWLYNKDVIHDGENGILVPIKNSQAIADAILQLYCDRELAHSMAVNNVRASKKYSPENVLKALFRDLDKNGEVISDAKD